jgi:hypothetical protein
MAAAVAVVSPGAVEFLIAANRQPDALGSLGQLFIDFRQADVD